MNMEYVEEIQDNKIFRYKPGTSILHNPHGPAIEFLKSTKRLYPIKNGYAVEDVEVRYYYIDGVLSRYRHPAIEYSNGYGQYFLNGKRLLPGKDQQFHVYKFEDKDYVKYTLDPEGILLHNELGPAFESKSGNKLYCYMNRFHNENGPALDYANGDKIYMIDGLYHNIRDAARQYKDFPDKFPELWKHGVMEKIHKTTYLNLNKKDK